MFAFKELVLCACTLAAAAAATCAESLPLRRTLRLCSRHSVSCFGALVCRSYALPGALITPGPPELSRSEMLLLLFSVLMQLVSIGLLAQYSAFVERAC